MKILIDGHMLKNHEGGNERYVANIYKNFKNQPKKIFILRRNWLGNNFFRLLFQIPWLVYKNKINIVHSTYIGPLFNVCKSVITVHDLSFKKYREFFNLKDRFILNFLLPASLKQAAAIIVPSNFTKGELIKYYPAYRKKVFKVYYGVDDIFKVIKKKDLKEKFLLTINSKNPRKNINNIVKAFNKLSRLNVNLKLVIVGGKNNIEQKLLKNSKIKIFDYVTDEKLNWLYNNCRIFISNSLYEGFDLPVIEALKCGAFVIASDIPVHREISGNQLIYVNPNNYLDLYNKLNYYLSRPYLIKKIINQTSKIADKYSWKKTVKETLKIYKKILKK